MWTVAEANLVPILIALLIGLVTAFWTFKGRRQTSADSANDISRETPLP